MMKPTSKGGLQKARSSVKNLSYFQCKGNLNLFWKVTWFALNWQKCVLLGMVLVYVLWSGLHCFGDYLCIIETYN